MNTKATRHSKAKRIGIIVATVFVSSIVGLVMIGSISNWNFARPWIADRVSDAIDRPFAINGDLRLHWVRKVESLHWWLPRPRIEASDMTLGNPEWSKEKDFGKIKRITFVFDPLPLFQRTIVLPLLDVEGANVALVRDIDDRNNWTFGKKEENAEPSQWRFAPGVLRIHQSAIQIDDAKRKLKIKAEADTDANGIAWSASGSLNQAELNARGGAGSILALQDKKTPYPFKFFLDMGETHISAVGTLTNPSQLAALDVALKISGASMAQLFPITNIVLPETPAYATEGRLRGTLNELGGKWRYENFKGKVGGSDLHGTFEYEARATRPLITAKLISHTLNFADLAPLIGADSNANKARRNAAVLQPEDKALPVEPFKTERWSSVDAHVEFDGEKIIREAALPIDHLHTVVDLKEGVLTLRPLNFGMAGGELASTIVLDGRKQPLVADIRIAPKHLKLKELFPTAQSMQASIGEVNGSAALIGTGNSISALLGSSNGEVKLFVDRGSVSKFILEAAGLNVANVVVTKLFGDRQINLNCGAADFKVVAGTMQTEGFIVDTDEALINVDGDIDLATEKLGLTVRPQSKGLRLLSLRAPLYINGTFKKPDISIDKKVLALRGGGAIALGAVALPAAIVPLAATGASDSAAAGSDKTLADNGCGELLERAKQKSVSRR